MKHIENWKLSRRQFQENEPSKVAIVEFYKKI